MKNPVPAVFLIVLLSLPVSMTARAEDYFKNALLPAGADDRGSQLYPAYDFDDVIFSREYFYTLEEGKAQYDRSGGDAWKTLGFDFGIFGVGKGKTE